MPRSSLATAAAAPPLTELEEQLLEVVTGFVNGCRESGSMVQEGGKPFHRVGCECEICLGARLLAYAGDRDRCMLCGCTDDEACDEGCAWADAEHLVCTAHPPRAIAAALKVARRELPKLRGGRRG